MTYQKELENVIRDWNTYPITDEWLFEKFSERYALSLNSTEAFVLIEPTILFLLNNHDESTSIEIIQTLIILARKSNTSEVPLLLLLKINELKNMFLHFGEYANSKLTELLGYYRLS